MSKSDDGGGDGAAAEVPDVRVEPAYAVVLAGSRLNFRCSVQLSATNIDLQWVLRGESWAKDKTTFHILQSRYHQMNGTVRLAAAKLEDAGNVECVGVDLRSGGLNNTAIANVTVLDAARLEMSAPASRVTAKRGASLDLSVEVVSVPPLNNCTWLHDGLPVINASASQKCEVTPRGDRCKCSLSLRRIVPDEAGNYSAVAHNDAAQKAISVIVNVTSEPAALAFLTSPSHVQKTKTLEAALGAVTVAMTLIAGVLLYKYKQKPHYEVQWKIIESVDHDTNEYIYIDPGKMTYDHRRWEVARATLFLGETLGSGAFGEVVAAVAHGLHGQQGRTTHVAVKRLKKNVRAVERAALLTELKILCHVGQHRNIVNLLGACTEREPVLIITEFCRHGDLLTFLRAHGPTGPTGPPKPGLAPQHSVYGNLVQPGGSEGGVLQPRELLSLCHQVAGGMAFLSSRKCLHRDVAARNVLLADGLCAKICDFGLARDVTRDPNYIQRGNARLPIKWMAPESVFHCVFSLQSDVWAYGVLVWEVYSYGESPYPHMEVDDTFFQLLQDGYRMEAPKGCPPAMYELMLLCWDTNPDARPAFRDVEALLGHMMPSGEETGPPGAPGTPEEATRPAEKGAEPGGWLPGSGANAFDGDSLTCVSHYQKPLRPVQGRGEPEPISADTGRKAGLSLMMGRQSITGHLGQLSQQAN